MHSSNFPSKHYGVQCKLIIEYLISGGLNTASVLLSKTHRRQTSHPVGNGSNVNSGTTGNGTDNTNSLAAEMIVSSMLANSSRMKAAGHRRSHSYGHHKVRQFIYVNFLFFKFLSKLGKFPRY